jgi:hypothetical protein
MFMSLELSHHLSRGRGNSQNDGKTYVLLCQQQYLLLNVIG